MLDTAELVSIATVTVVMTLIGYLVGDVGGALGAFSGCGVGGLIIYPLVRSRR